MKNLAYFLFLLMPMFCFGQNHVPNGDFEQYINCPTSVGQVPNCTGWSNISATPDYFNRCATGLTANVPNNAFGYQQPASGDAYMGVASRTLGFRETFKCHIIPLAPTHTYNVSFSYCRGEAYTYASDNFGIFFYDTIGTITSASIQTLIPQISFLGSTPPTDTANWTRYSTTFYADSAYDNIILGMFYPDSVVNMVQVTTVGGSFSYYYIDSLVISEVDNINISQMDTAWCSKDSVHISIYTYHNLQSTNTFTAQISDNTGNFTNPTTIGTLTSDRSGTISCYIPNTLPTGSGYKVRILSTAPVDTSYYIPAIKIANLDSANIQVSSNSPICAGGMLNLSASSVDNFVIYNWNGPNSFSSTVGAPSIANTTINNSGDYIVTSTLYSCTQIDTLPVQVKPNPAKPTITATNPVCQYDSLYLTANSTTSGVTYGWNGPNSYYTNIQNPMRTNISPSDAGTYTGFAILNGCVSSNTITVQVKPSPDSVNVTSNSPLCTGDTLHLVSDTSTGNVSYTWNGPNSFSTNAVNADIANSMINTTGWYSMTVDLNGCSYIDSTYVVVNQTPIQPSISFNTPLCAGETLNLNASGNSNYSYQWYGPSSFSANTKNTTRSNAQTNHSGLYKVTAIENGCVSDTGFATITINPLPFAVITSTPADSICVGQLANFTALPGNVGSNPQYNWYVNTQLVASGITYNTTTLNNQDVVYCEMTDNTKCSMPYTDQSNFLTMTVLPWLAPSVTITVSPTGPVQSGTFLTFTATTTNAGNKPQYQWKRNGKDIVGATGSTWGALSLNNNDTITVDIISDYKCPQPTNAVSNKIVTQIEGVGINEIAGLTDLTLAPNPNSGQFVLSGQLNHQGMVHISVMNMLGQTIYQTESKVINNQLHQQIALPQVARGMYLLQLQVSGQKINIRFSVK